MQFSVNFTFDLLDHVGATRHHWAVAEHGQMERKEKHIAYSPEVCLECHRAIFVNFSEYTTSLLGEYVGTTNSNP